MYSITAVKSRRTKTSREVRIRFFMGLNLMGTYGIYNSEYNV